MSNSVVKVTDATVTDSLLLLVNEDGTVTPSKDVVEAFLTSKTSATNLQVMHINKTDDQSVEVDVDNMLYVPNMDTKCAPDINLDEIAYNLYNVQLDHDYTSHCKPPEDDEDELAKTLSILDGNEEEISDVSKDSESKQDDIKEFDQTYNSHKSKIKLMNTSLKTPPKPQEKRKSKTQEKTGGRHIKMEYCEDGGFEYNDYKNKTDKKLHKPELKNKEGPLKVLKISKSVDESDLKERKSPHGQDLKTPDKKQLKKDRRPVKPVPDDFALFSTPDIIRRVGGRDAIATNSSDLSPSDLKPAKIETRSKSASDFSQLSTKQNRLSLDGKISDRQLGKSDYKSKDRKPELAMKKTEGVAKKIGEDLLIAKNEGQSSNQMEVTSSDTSVSGPSSYEKAYGNTEPLDTQDLPCNEPNITLDGSSLDLDPTLLDNINNDLISEDILYQVAQSLVSNTELQNAIDKSLNDENLVLDSAVQEALHKQEAQEQSNQAEQITSTPTQKGTQIVRPDGRIVVIPPIERPATRSRNKKKEEDKTLSKLTGKPLDEEHVSGNELDSFDEEEEESEDDPNKLWCICNQPHNNRFMICCDTCEEWYHGKCVNITKAMGQQMESEGKEWICLFCKDPMLKRPQAAAKRIRKASRNSRQSSDSAGSTKVVETKPSSVPCVVCRKPSRSNSIFCSEACILVHAQGVERVVVFERATGNMLTGNKAPSAANLEQWLKDHPGYEVVRSAGKIVTTKQPHSVSHSKLNILKTLGGNVNQSKPSSEEMKSVPKSQNAVIKPSTVKGNISSVKIISKQIPVTQEKSKVGIAPPSKESVVSLPKVKVLQSSIKSATPTNKDKLVGTKIQKTRPNEQTSTSTTPTKQENIRENVQKTIFEQLTNRLKMVDDLKLSEDELKTISNDIESQLYKCFGDTGQKYRNKYRSLIFNIKDIKNQTLWRRICEKSINPYQLVRLSPDDLASQELALWREREAKHQLDMIKKSELELLQCNRQYVLKTHKGEQILEDNRPTDNIDNTEVITSLTDASSGDKSEKKRDSSKDNERRSSKHSHKDKERKTNKEKSENKSSHHSHRSTSRDHDRSRRRSRSRDRSSKHADRRSRSRGRDRHKKSSHKSSRHKRETHRGSSTDKLDKKSKEILEQLVDSKIVPPLEDRLWKHVPQEDILSAPQAESDSDHEPSSTVTIPTPPRSNDADEPMANLVQTEDKNEKIATKEQSEAEKAVSSPTQKHKSEEIWRGIINMIDVAQISITAHEVSGDCNGLAAELPANLDIVGRISPDTVWDYIGKMKCSNSKIISIVRLNAMNVEEKMPYLALYSYLSSRNRLGVVKSTNKAVKDFYILPLASQKPIPQALLPLNGPGFEEARPALLLGIIVRDKRKRPFFDSSATPVPNVKRAKTESVVQSTPPPKSYTPPPVKENRLKLPLPPPVVEQDGDEPYSPEDSDPDSCVPSTSGSVAENPTTFLESDRSSQTFQPFINKFDDIPGLGNTALPSSTQEIQRQMEKLNKEIEMQKSEINSISQNIATASTEIGTSALANIALPSNLQQILDSIKTIGSTPPVDAVDNKVQGSLPQENPEFTIPLILPTTFARHPANSTAEHASENTIPLNLPSKKKVSSDADKSSSVLSSLSEEDLIRKAQEMLEETKPSSQNGSPVKSTSQLPESNAVTPQKLPKIELNQPMIPGLENDDI